MEINYDLIIDKIERTFSNLNYKGQTLVYLDGAEVKDRNLYDFLTPSFFADLNILTQIAIEFPNDKDRVIFSKKIYTAMRKRHIVAKSSALRNNSMPESRPNFDQYIPAIDVETGNKILINAETNELSKMIFQVWFDALQQDQKNSISDVMRYSIFKYDPYDISTMTMVPYENFKILKINLYTAPPWRLNEAPASQECPPVIWRLLTHLFPKHEAREFVLDWLFWALVKRQETYLVLNGAKGIGKGIFQKLARMLVGRDNYSEAPEGLLDSQFNSVLDKKRIIVFDELRVDKDRHTRLKRYINKFQAIEKKGLDADKSIETFNSFIIANNDEKDMYIEYDDRRFSVIDMTDKALYDSIDKETVAELDRAIEEEDADLAYDFGYFIFLRGAKRNDEFSIYKGEKFYRLAHSSLAQWKKLLLDKIFIDKETSINIDRVRKLDKANNPRSQFPRDIQKVKDFLMNYRHNGLEPIGEVVESDGEYYLEVNPKIMGEEDVDLL